MADRPILFSAPMIRALISGSKTQTRRVLREQRQAAFRGVDRDGNVVFAGWATYGKPRLIAAKGDRLWVREGIAQSGALVSYTAGGPSGHKLWPTDWSRPTRPSIHMPRWASRLTLIVTDVRIERLQDVSEADAVAEGVEPPETEREDLDCSICPMCGGTGLHGALGANLGFMEVDCADCDTNRKRYQHLWNAINGPGSWDANPWVAAYTFEVKRHNIDSVGGRT